jgi:hypothetical protein
MKYAKVKSISPLTVFRLSGPVHAFKMEKRGEGKRGERGRGEGGIMI